MTVFGAIINGIGSLIGGGVQAATNKKISDQNLAFQRENLSYQQQLQQQIFEREDNAIQRRAEDLEAAGLSKTLAAGSAAGAGTAISTTAPQRTPVDLLTPVTQALSAMQSIDMTRAQLSLIEQQAAESASRTAGQNINNEIKAHDAGIIKDYGVLSNIGGRPADTLNTILALSKGRQLGADLNSIVNNGVSFFKPYQQAAESALGNVVDSINNQINKVTGARDLKNKIDSNISPIRKDMVPYGAQKAQSYLPKSLQEWLDLNDSSLGARPRYKY